LGRNGGHFVRLRHRCEVTRGEGVARRVFALAAKNTQRDATITVNRKDGNVAIYQVTGVSGGAVRAKLQPFLIEHDVTCLDDAPLFAAAPAAPVDDPAEQLKKLADLHDSGLLTDEEFAAKRAAIVDRL